MITKIILNKLEQNNFSFLVFYRNRIRRILPAVVIVLAATSLVSWLFLFPDELIELSRHLFSSVLFYQNFQLLDGKGYWDQASQLKPLLHFWSLSIEEQFYIFWPLLLFFVIRTRKRIHWIALAFFLTATVSVSNEDSFYHSLSRFWELAFGASLVSFEKGEYWKKFQAWKWLVWLVFAGVIVSFSMTSSYEHMHMLALCLVTGLLILSAVKSKDAILSNRALVFFGLISFPLYLWHYPIISFTYIFSLPPSVRVVVTFSKKVSPFKVGH